MKTQIQGQQRHTLGTVSSMVVGAGLAQTDQAQAAITLLEAIGAPPELMIAGGLLLVAAAHLMSWRSPEKKTQEPTE